MDGRDAMLAVAMNGEPLPIEHGFPVRMVVPGLYGYVSATKWVVDMELTTFDAYDAYWIARGWAQQAPIKTAVPDRRARRGSSSSPGPRRRGRRVGAAPGIEAVEVQIDDGRWQAGRARPTGHHRYLAAMALPVGRDAGRAPDAVRATDGAGRSRRPAPPCPDGATGYHTIAVEVA